MGTLVGELSASHDSVLGVGALLSLGGFPTSFTAAFFALSSSVSRSELCFLLNMSSMNFLELPRSVVGGGTGLTKEGRMDILKDDIG